MSKRILSRTLWLAVLLAAVTTLLACSGECRHLNVQTDRTLPNCSEQGYTLNTCTDCGFSFKSDIIAPYGHTLRAEVTEPETTPEVTTEPEPEVTETPWNLVLVNPWYPLPEEYSFELETVTGKYKMDSRCVPALKQMLADCKAAGLTPYICSAYRTWDDQTYLFDKKVNSFISKGYSEAEAKVLAAKETAVPGTSEHQLGLAVDILCVSRPWLDDGQADTATQQWLMANCHKYGFILRYPKGTTHITGIIYEPWHYRYVGVEIATEIMTKGITFEEYLGKIGAPETTPVETTVNG